MICCLFNLLILIPFSNKSRTSKATEMEIFIEIFWLTIVTKNFVLDATCVLDPLDKLKISPNQCSHQNLYSLFLSVSPAK